MAGKGEVDKRLTVEWQSLAFNKRDLEAAETIVDQMKDWLERSGGSNLICFWIKEGGYQYKVTLEVAQMLPIGEIRG